MFWSVAANFSFDLTTRTFRPWKFSVVLSFFYYFLFKVNPNLVQLGF